MTSTKNHQKDVTHLLSYLKDIASAVMYAAEAEELEQVLERIANLSRELVNAQYAALGVPDGKGDLLYFKYVGVTPETARDIGHPPIGRGLLGAIMLERASIRVPEISKDPRSCGFPAYHPEMHRFLGVPIQTGDQLFGMLYMCDRVDGQPFTEQDQWLVETMAGYAALAVAGSLLSAQKQRLTLLEERQRIGMELHDGIIQSLYAVGMQLDLLRTANHQIPSGEIKPVMDMLNTIIEDIRSYILDLNTRGEHQKTIRQSIEEIVGRLHVTQSVAIEINAPDTYPPFTPTAFESVCAIINEVLSNALRHANATKINIAVREEHHEFIIMIEDNGSGFDLETLQGHSGLGLHNIKQRVRLQGGTVEIQTQLGQGTGIYVNIPVQR